MRPGTIGEDVSLHRRSAGLNAARHLLGEAGLDLVEERPGDTWGTRASRRRFEPRFGEGH